MASRWEGHAKAFESCKLKRSDSGLEIHPAPQFLPFAEGLTFTKMERSARKEPTSGLNLQVECLEKPLNLSSRLRMEKKRSPRLV